MIWVFLVAILALLVGSYSDFKTREVPDWVNFGFIFIGLGLHTIESVLQFSFMPLFSSIAGLVLGMAVAFSMYYLGQWGGGDAKMLMGLGAVIGLDFTINSFFISLLVNIFLFGALYGILYGAVLAIKHRKNFPKTYKKLIKKHLMLRKITIISFVLLFVLSFLFAKQIQLIILLLILIGIISYYIWVFAKAVEKCCMLRYKRPSEITEGDWIAKNVYVKGKYLCGPKDLGIGKKQITLLKKYKIKKVLVKDGIPFVPSFLISFILTLFIGNIMFYFISSFP